MSLYLRTYTVKDVFDHVRHLSIKDVGVHMCRAVGRKVVTVFKTFMIYYVMNNGVLLIEIIFKIRVFRKYCPISLSAQVLIVFSIHTDEKEWDTVQVGSSNSSFIMILSITFTALKILLTFESCNIF